MATQRQALAVLLAQHRAIDALMARLCAVDRSFMPSKSGPIWEAVVAGNQLIQEMEHTLSILPGAGGGDKTELRRRMLEGSWDNG